jgi:DNA-3-methyladenine glycosylase
LTSQCEMLTVVNIMHVWLWSTLTHTDIERTFWNHNFAESATKHDRFCKGVGRGAYSWKSVSGFKSWMLWQVDIHVEKYTRCICKVLFICKDLLAWSRILISMWRVSGAGAAVLLRALEPLEGLQYMQLQRQKGRKAPSSQTELKAQDLCNGPAKLCMSFSITKSSCNEQDLTAWDGMWIQEDESFVPCHVVISHRIGVDSVGSEWASKPLRFYLLGNPSVSRRDRDREKELREMVKPFY